jgi:hypothetical protein
MEAYEIDQDCTLLTQVLYSYKRIVHNLLNAKSVPGLGREQLASFKQHFGSSAFVCRFRGCPRATNGYPTEQGREDHESLQHTGGIKCSEMSCSWSRIGFKTSAALKRHMQNYHSLPESVKKPSAIRRKYICGDPASVSASWGCGQRFALENELQDHFKSAAGRLCFLAKNNLQQPPPSFRSSSSPELSSPPHSLSDPGSPGAQQLTTDHRNAQISTFSIKNFGVDGK